MFARLGRPEALRRSAEPVRDSGLQEKLCIRPGQVGPVNEAFPPTDEEVARSERHVAAFEDTGASGSASIRVGGYFIDGPLVEKARHTLRIAESTRRRGARAPAPGPAPPVREVVNAAAKRRVAPFPRHRRT